MISYYSQIDYRTAREGKRMLIPTQPLEIVCLTEGKDILIHTWRWYQNIWFRDL